MGYPITSNAYFDLLFNIVIVYLIAFGIIALNLILALTLILVNTFTQDKLTYKLISFYENTIGRFAYQILQYGGIATLILLILYSVDVVKQLFLQL